MRTLLGRPDCEPEAGYSVQQVAPDQIRPRRVSILWSPYLQSLDYGDGSWQTPLCPSCQHCFAGSRGDSVHRDSRCGLTSPPVIVMGLKTTTRITGVWQSVRWPSGPDSPRGEFAARGSYKEQVDIRDTRVSK
jgi:hypothetical protein